MIHKMQTAKWPMFNAHNPYRDGIYAINLVFAAQALREVREALEMEVAFNNDFAERKLAECLKEAKAIAKLMEEDDGH